MPDLTRRKFMQSATGLAAGAGVPGGQASQLLMKAADATDTIVRLSPHVAEMLNTAERNSAFFANVSYVSQKLPHMAFVGINAPGAPLSAQRYITEFLKPELAQCHLDLERFTQVLAPLQNHRDEIMACVNAYTPPRQQLEREDENARWELTREAMAQWLEDPATPTQDKIKFRDKIAQGNSEQWLAQEPSEAKTGFDLWCDVDDFFSESNIKKPRKWNKSSRDLQHVYEHKEEALCNQFGLIHHDDAGMATEECQELETEGSFKILWDKKPEDIRASFDTQINALPQQLMSSVERLSESSSRPDIAAFKRDMKEFFQNDWEDMLEELRTDARIEAQEGPKEKEHPMVRSFRERFGTDLEPRGELAPRAFSR